MQNPIPDEKIGIITPRAFTKYDQGEEPDPKYFKEILENSLSEVEISEFCEDFLKLLNFNKKGHKDRVQCLTGDANSGKTSLFHPILGLVHHTNIATITKQRVFNKAMITKSTEVVFIDEASPSSMDIDDWKILTQGGYTACDVKYQTAKSFINRCPMLLTAQTKLQFKPEDQPAMDRRLRNYNFKSLPHPKKGAAKWLRRHPMECIVWAAAQASRCVASATEDELSDEDSADDDVLGATEKEELRTLCLDNVLDERDCPTVEAGAQSGAIENTQEDLDSSQDDQTIGALRRIMEQSSQRSLRHRQVSVMLQARLDQRERQRQAEETVYRHRQRNLLSMGVASEHVALLPRDALEPMPTQISEDLAAFRQQTLREDLKTRRERALAAFQTPWLQQTEHELHELARTLQGSALSRERRASTEAYREVLQDKLRQFHQNHGTAGCQLALDQRKRSSVALGLLKKEHRHLVTSLFQCLPIAEDVCQSIRTGRDGNEASSSGYRSNTAVSQDVPPQCGDSSDEEMFITPAPSTQLSPCDATTPTSSTMHDLAISEDLMRTSTSRKRPTSGELTLVRNKKPRKTILSYFSQ